MAVATTKLSQAKKNIAYTFRGKFIENVYALVRLASPANQQQHRPFYYCHRELVLTGE